MNYIQILYILCRYYVFTLILAKYTTLIYLINHKIFANISFVELIIFRK